MSDHEDKNVTESFRHRDPRSTNRVIKLTDVYGHHEKRGTIYSYVVVTNDGYTKSVGRRGKISQQTLDREYERISK